MKTIQTFFIVISIMISQTLFAQQYAIPYTGGLDTLYANPGDVVGNEELNFYFEGDQFLRDDGLDGIITLSSHGFKIFGKNLRMQEDTVKGYVTIYEFTICEDPNSLLASKDNRTIGDQREPETNKKPEANNELENNNPFNWLLFTGFLILLFIILIRRIRWW